MFVLPGSRVVDLTTTRNPKNHTMAHTKHPHLHLAVATFAAVALAAPIPVKAAPIEVPNWNFEVPRSLYPTGLPDGQNAYIMPSEQSWHQYDNYQNGGTAAYWNPGVGAVGEAVGRWANVGFGGNAPEGNHVGLAVCRWNDNKLPDGNTGVYVRNFEAICQVLENVLFDPTKTYTLTVKVGHVAGSLAEGAGSTPPTNGHPEWHGYFVQLLAGGEETTGGALRDTVYAVNGGTVIAENDNTVTIAANTFESITVTYTPGDLTPEQETALAGLPIQIRLGAYENPSDHSTTSLAAFDSVTLDGPGTAPAAPFMATITPAVAPATGYDIQWPSQAGATYTLFTSTGLATAIDRWTVVEAAIAPTPPKNTYNVPANGPRRFYAVKEVSP